MMKIRISDHALIRWLERVRGFTFEDLLRSVGDRGTLKAFGHTFEAENGVLITILPDSGEPNRTKHRIVTGNDRVK